MPAPHTCCPACLNLKLPQARTWCAGVFSTTCDAQGGQSGSPIYTGTVPAVARGVLTGGFEGPSYNDANMGRSSVGTLFSGDTGTLVWWWTTWSFNQFAGK